VLAWTHVAIVNLRDSRRERNSGGRPASWLAQWSYKPPEGTAVERNTKLVVAWHFGKRSQTDADLFCERLRDATTGHFQISTDGFAPYKQAVPVLLGGRVGFGMLIKIFGEAPEDEQRKYSPATIKAIRKEKVSGNPDSKRICTSHTERANGTMRTFIKGMGRLTCCFSKLWDNHEAMLELYFAHYNFCRVHGTLKTTPAVATGLADRPWDDPRLAGSDNGNLNEQHTNHTLPARDSQLHRLHVPCAVGVYADCRDDDAFKGGLR